MLYLALTVTMTAIGGDLIHVVVAPTMNPTLTPTLNPELKAGGVA